MHTSETSLRTKLQSSESITAEDVEAMREKARTSGRAEDRVAYSIAKLKYKGSEQ